VPDLTSDELAFLESMFDLARRGDVATLTGCVDAGVPVNLTNGRGDSLLLLAAYHQHPVLVWALLERGADTERDNDNGQTALAAAVFRQCRPVVQALLDVGADPTAGRQSAVEVARFFRLGEMAELLRTDALSDDLQHP
jgi:ankyrin repeat protein